MNRHYLLTLNNKGINFIADNYKELNLEEDFLKSYFNDKESLPVIVKQQSKPIDDTVEVGIAFPVHEGNVRLRRSTVIDTDMIKNQITPYQVTNMIGNLPNSIKKTVAEVKKQVEYFGGELGIFGSAALEAVTQKAYLHPTSDIDLIIKNITQPSRFKAFVEGFNIGESKFLLDAEVFLPEYGSIKVGELKGETSTFLVKGLYKSFLVPREEIF